MEKQNNVMESFAIYYEKFSLNPLNWFKKTISESEKKMRDDAKIRASEYIPKLKKLLKERGYTIEKAPFSYTVRKDRKMGLSKNDTRLDATKYKNPLNNINYIRVLFTMAHEVGHVLQWNEETNTPEMFWSFFNQLQLHKNSSDSDFVKELEHIHKIWYELDAWIKGMDLIPSEYKQAYKQYAYKAYNTYMKKNPKYYYNEMLLRNLLYRLKTN